MEQINHIDSLPIEPNEAVRPFRRPAASRRPLVKERRLPTPRNGAKTEPLLRNGALNAAQNGRMRRAPTPRPSSMQARSGGLFSARGIVVMALLALALGIFIGASVSRQRQRRREVLISVTPKEASDQPLPVANITIGSLLQKLQEMQTPVPVAGSKDKMSYVLAGPVAVQALITQALALQFFKAQDPNGKKHILPSKLELDRRFAEITKAPDALKKLQDSGQNLDEAKFNLRLAMAQENMLVGRIEPLIKGGKALNSIPVNETEAKIYWSENIDPTQRERQRFYTPETVEAQAIVTQDDPPRQSNARSAHQKITDALVALNNGKPMDSVAQEFNTQEMKEITLAGKLPIVHKGYDELNNVPGLETTIFKLQPNEQSRPMQFYIGKVKTWWIIRCIRHVSQTFDSYDDVKQECATAVALQKMRKDKKLAQPRIDALDQKLADFRRTTNLQTFNDAYKEIIDKIRANWTGH